MSASKTILLVLASLVVLLVLGYFYVLNFSPDRNRFPVRGIDVSHHQGEINWTDVAKDDVAFAYIKASEGGDFVDKMFRKNAVGATQEGILIGAYHFFTLCRSGSEQALNLLNQIDGIDLALPVAVDLEFEGNCSARPTKEEFEAELLSFVSLVEEEMKRDVIFHSTHGFLWDYGDVLPQRQMWLRWIAIEPFWTEWQFWQYDDDATVRGIEGPVDLNVFVSTKDQFLDKFALPTS